MASAITLGLFSASVMQMPVFAADTGKEAAVLKAASDEAGIIRNNIFENGLKLSQGQSVQLPAVTPELLGLADGQTLESYSYSVSSWDTDVLSVEESGGNWICKGLKKGSATLELSYTYSYSETYSGYDEDDTYTETYTDTDTKDIDVTVTVNMDQVSLPSSAELYNTGYDSDSSGSVAVIPIRGADGAFDGYADYADSSDPYNFDISVSGSGVKLASSGDSYLHSESYISGDKLYVPLTGEGTATLTLVLNGKTFEITVTLYKVRLNGAVLLAKGKTKTLKVSGINASQVKWSSENKKIVSVNKKTGKVRAKKNGNALIYAKIGDQKLGTVVSVTSSKKISAVNYGIHIAETCKYSQSKRMQSGYYDCSSLVWKSYHHAKGCNFGSSSYAPTAAEEAKYLAGKGKIIGNYTDSNVQSMKFQAGDVLFKTDSGKSNGRYKGIYHAELFAGYEFAGFDWEGQPVIETRWCARANNYGGWDGDIVGRP